jgi:hypothetical protein
MEPQKRKFSEIENQEINIAKIKSIEIVKRIRV